MYHFPSAKIAKKHSAKRALGIVINMHFFPVFPHTLLGRNTNIAQ